MIKNVLLTTALKEEYPYTEYDVIYTGVGKVNATINLYSQLVKNTEIKLVINVGTAGGVNCKKGDIIECGIFEDGQLEYPGSVDEIIIFDESKSKILTFDNFIHKVPMKYCNCVDMESFALAKVCKKMNVQFKCIKYISDIVGEVNQQNVWIENVTNGKELLRNKVEKIVQESVDNI